jgi:GDP-L-fucose synthase
MKKNSCILVTGANGLAGSAVVEHLRAHEFTCVVPITRQDCDLRDPAAVIRMFDRIEPEYVYHPAATVYGIMGNMKNQAKSIYDNTMINTNVIHASHIVASVKKIVAMGTNAIYPWPPKLPYSEANIFDGRPHDMESGYGHAKRHMLAMLEAYKESHGLDYAYLVSGNLYGPRDRFNVETGHVLPSLIKKFYDASIRPDDVVSIWGDGTPTRDFLYSADLAHIVRIVLPSAPDTGGAINIGNGQSWSIKDTVYMLAEISGVGYDRVQFDTTKPNGRPDCYADLSKLNALGFTPEYPLPEGLRATYKWFKAARSRA